MHDHRTLALAIFLLAALISPSFAQSYTTPAGPPTDQEAIAIISTRERIKPSFYKIIRITPGQKHHKDGFIQGNVIRVTAFAPESARNPSRTIKHYLMQHTQEYGWFIECRLEDSRGIYLEISSQKKGRVIVR